MNNSHVPLEILMNKLRTCSYEVEVELGSKGNVYCFNG